MDLEFHRTRSTYLLCTPELSSPLQINQLLVGVSGIHWLHLWCGANFVSKNHPTAKLLIGTSNASKTRETPKKDTATSRGYKWPAYYGGNQHGSAGHDCFDGGVKLWYSHRSRPTMMLRSIATWSLRKSNCGIHTVQINHGGVLALGAHCVHIAHAEAGILTQEYLSPV